MNHCPFWLGHCLFQIIQDHQMMFTFGNHPDKYRNFLFVWHAVEIIYYSSATMNISILLVKFLYKWQFNTLKEEARHRLCINGLAVSQTHLKQLANWSHHNNNTHKATRFVGASWINIICECINTILYCVRSFQKIVNYFRLTCLIPCLYNNHVLLWHAQSGRLWEPTRITGRRADRSWQTHIILFYSITHVFIAKWLAFSTTIVWQTIKTMANKNHWTE